MSGFMPPAAKPATFAPVNSQKTPSNDLLGDISSFASLSIQPSTNSSNNNTQSLLDGKLLLSHLFN